MTNHLGPYYQTDNVTLYHGDCLEVLPTLGDSSIDLIFVDWPYYRVKGEAWDRQWSDESKFLEWIGQTLEQSRRLLKPNGSFYGCASPQMANKVEAKIGEYFNVLNSIRWYKDDGWHKKADKESIRSYLSPWEAIILAEQWWTDETAAGESGYYSQCKALHKEVYAPIGRYIQMERERAGVTRNDVEIALGYVSSSDPTRGTALCYRWEEGSSLPTRETYERLREYLNSANGHNDYLRRDYEDLRRDYEDLRRPFNCSPDVPYTDLWTFQPVKDYPGKHPTEKPLAMLEHIISVSSKPGATILDFCMGNGTTIKAAQNLGRKAIGIDITEAYCRRTVERLSQLNLFNPVIIETTRQRSEFRQLTGSTRLDDLPLFSEAQ